MKEFIYIKEKLCQIKNLINDINNIPSKDMFDVWKKGINYIDINNFLYEIFTNNTSIGGLPSYEEIVVKLKKQYGVNYLLEDIICAYFDFIDFCVKTTDSLINDPNKHIKDKVNGKSIGIYSFFRFSKFLNEKDKLIAKLLYFYSIDLSSIMRLSVNDLEYKSLNISGNTIEISEDVYLTIKCLVENRKNGLIFLGRQGKNYSSATVFRNFKTASDKCRIMLSCTITPATLLQNKYLLQA